MLDSNILNYLSVYKQRINDKFELFSLDSNTWQNLSVRNQRMNIK